MTPRRHPKTPSRQLPASEVPCIKDRHIAKSQGERGPQQVGHQNGPEVRTLSTVAQFLKLFKPQLTDSSQRTKTTSGPVQNVKLSTSSGASHQPTIPPVTRPHRKGIAVSLPTRTPSASSVLPAETAAGSSTKPSRASESGAGPSKAPSLTSSAAASSSKSHSEPQPRQVNIGIETEFYIAEARGWHLLATRESFVEYLASRYNSKVPPEHPRMRVDLQVDEEYGDPYDKWAMVQDYSVINGYSPCEPPPLSPGCSLKVYSS